MKSKLEEAIQLRKDNKLEEAIVLLKSILQNSPLDPDVNYQIAWTFDLVGKESEAAPYYEKAIANGLISDRTGAFVGLGSTYRCLGEYEKSLKVFDQGIIEFPEDRSLKVFRALTYFNLGNAEKAMKDLIVQLIETTSDKSIKSYDKALKFYSDKLSQTWK